MLMVLGGWFAVTGASGRALHGMSWLRILAGAYLVFAMAVTLMRHSPALSAYLPDFVVNSIAPTDKENLAPYRVIHFLALAFLATHLIPADHPGLQWRPLQAVITCGEEWLAVFCVAVFLSFAGHLILITGAEPGRDADRGEPCWLRGDDGGGLLYLLVEAAGRTGRRCGSGPRSKADLLRLEGFSRDFASRRPRLIVLCGTRLRLRYAEWRPLRKETGRGDGEGRG